MSDPNEHEDQDAVEAACELVGRAGAQQLEVGYTDDEAVAAEDADWYAHAQYAGTRIMVEGRRGPIEALEALARKLLNGGQCTHCGRTITLSGGQPNLDLCRWTRMGKHWVRGCVDTHAEDERPYKPADPSAPFVYRRAQ